jgi:FdhE protein
MRGDYGARIDRAKELASVHPAASELLGFYQRIATLQKTIYEEIGSAMEKGAWGLLPYFPKLIEIVRGYGPETLANHGDHLGLAANQESLLLTFTYSPSAVKEPSRFYALALLQPRAERIVSMLPAELERLPSECPACMGLPVTAVLRPEGEGAKRALLCSMCSTEWLFRRVLCPKCGQEDKEKLPIYSASDFPHVRVEACDVCKTYIKAVDLAKDGRAVPVVDELATVALDVWAQDHGYEKLETNILGL